jgi:adenine phosphoribosyltransferase
MSEELKKYVRDIPDFPKPGIIFRDITTILKDPVSLKLTAKELFLAAENLSANKVVGIEARGFIFGAMLANKLDAGFVPIRKPGKLPAAVEKQTYDLEYGTDTIEIHKDAILPGDKVIIHDDLLATGGTAKAAAMLIEKLGGKVLQFSFIIELGFLNGRKVLSDYDVKSIINYNDV